MRLRRAAAAALLGVSVGLASAPFAAGEAPGLLKREGARLGTDRAVTLADNLDITGKNLDALLQAVTPLYSSDHGLTKDEVAEARRNLAALFAESAACDRLSAEASIALKRSDLPRVPFAGELQMPTAGVNAAGMKDDPSEEDLRVAVAFDQYNVVRAQAYLLRMKMARLEGSPLASATASDLVQRRAWLAETRGKLRAAAAGRKGAK